MLNFDQNNAAVFAGATGNGADLAVVVGRDHRCLPPRVSKRTGKQLLTAYCTTPPAALCHREREDMSMSGRSSSWQGQHGHATERPEASVAPAIWAALMVYTVLEARGSAKFAGYALAGDVLAYRAGWLGRHWAVAKIAKGQTVEVARSPFDRRAGMASVALDTAGARTGGFALRVPYLAEAEARALAARVRALM